MKLGFKTPSPLNEHINNKRNETEFLRIHRIAKVFEHFHLKQAVIDKVDGRKIILNQKEVLNFGSANYLGFEQHPEVIQASKNATDELGTHSGCSRIFASHRNIIELENEISNLVGSENTLIGHNISQIHAGTIPALFSGENSILFIDRFAHTSIFQACQIAVAKQAKLLRVDVSNLAELASSLHQVSQENVKVLFVDGVYSMQGHSPDFPALEALCQETGTILYIDDAHGVGVFGANGGGVMEEYNLSYANCLLVGSLQKAFGTYGGFISGSTQVIDYLRCTSKAYIFSGTLQPAAVAGARKAIELTKSEEGKLCRQHLRSLSVQVRSQLQSLKFQVPSGESPIVPVFIGSDVDTLFAGRFMFDRGIYLNSVMYPAVPKENGMLRISLTSLHTNQDIDNMMAGFTELQSYLDHLQMSHLRWPHITKEVLLSKILGKHYDGL